MRLRRTVFAVLVGLLLILYGGGIAFAPMISDLESMGVPPGSIRAAAGDPLLIVDGLEVDLTELLNSDIPLFGSQETVLFPYSRVTVNHGEKRVKISLGNSSVGLQFLNSALSKTEDSFALRFEGQAQATLEIIAPRIDVVNDYALEVATEGQGSQRVCFLLDLEKKDGRVVIGEMRRVSFPGKTAPYTFIVSQDKPLAAGSVPAGLVAIPRTVSAYQSKGNMQLNQEAVYYLERMLVQAKNEGVGGFILTSTYRPFSYQRMLFNNKVKQVGSEAKAAAIVARPGTSEHQTGLAIDFSAGGTGLNKGFGATPHGRWLASNGWRYGFILRYPSDKTGTTKIIYEPWHFRYVGYPYSKIMYDRKLCLEEFAVNLEAHGFYAVSDEKNTYLCALNRSDGKLYLSEALPRTQH